MKTEYRTDPVTGVRYAWGGIYGIRTLDEQREQEQDVDRMLARRLPEIRNEVRRAQAAASPAPVPVPSRSSAAARFQHSTPAPAVYPAPSSTAHSGYRSRGLLVARETFDAIDPQTHKVVHVLADRTNVASGHWLLKVRPDAFQYAA